ncbi:MAG: AMP-binding protein [Phycisphaerae bacterium]
MPGVSNEKTTPPNAHANNPAPIRQGPRRTWAGRLLYIIARLALRLRYRVRVEGITEIKAKGCRGILFLPNHPAFIDPVIMVAHLYQPFAVRPLSAEDQIAKPLFRLLANTVRVLPIPQMSGLERGKTDRVQHALDRCVAALRQGDNVLLYPAGRLMRQQYTDLGGTSAVARILAQQPELRVVLVRTTGLWGSSFGWGAGTPPRLGRALTAHLHDLLLSGICFAPKRSVHIMLVEKEDFPRRAGRAEINRYLESFYNQEAPPARYVPYSIWERGRERDLPAPPSESRRSTQAVPPATEKIVLDYLREVTARPEITPGQQLAHDLGLDSLAIMDLMAWLEQEFGATVAAVESLETVGDVMLAACGKLAANAEDSAIPLPGPRWLMKEDHGRVQLPDGRTIQEVFLAQVRRYPDRVVAADPQRGCRSYRDLLTAIFALREEIQKISDPRVGIMLPASVVADTVFLAVLFSGKTPVMMNWTTGLRNMTYGMQVTGVGRILTADALLNRLAAQGIDLAAIQDRMIPLEKLAGSIGRRAKLRAAVLARCNWRSLKRAVPSDIAVILFTSGSESLPKAVPLTHENLLTNMRDALNCFYIRRDDRFIGMLPPFHSFGLNAAMLLPILAGVRVVHYPNPNDVPALVRIIENYQVSILLGTPTFVSNIVRGGGKNAFSSLRICVTGAEKCPASVYASLHSSCPNASILEGYGITECSPFVAVVREDDIRPGYIGIPFPSIQWAIVDEAAQQPAAVGQPGMLLLRGPSIFNGYLGNKNASPFVHWAGQTWYRTGDLVKVDVTGYLTFVGRLQRFVKLGGEMISLPAIEEVLEQQFPVTTDSGPTLAVIASASDDAAELVLVSTRALDRLAANAAIRKAGLSGLHHIRAVVQMEKLPVLGTGKIDYRTLESMIRDLLRKKD